MPRLKGLRFPREIIAYAIWVYHRFALNTADVEDLLAERGVIVSREAIHRWVNPFGRHFANCIRRDRPKGLTNGIWTKWSSRSTVGYAGLCGRWMRTEMLLICSSNHGGMPRQAQRFLSAHDQVKTVFCPLRYQRSAVSYRCARTDAFEFWDDYALEMTA